MRKICASFHCKVLFFCYIFMLSLENTKARMAHCSFYNSEGCCKVVTHPSFYFIFFASLVVPFPVAFMIFSWFSSKVTLAPMRAFTFRETGWESEICSHFSTVFCHLLLSDDFKKDPFKNELSFMLLLCKWWNDRGLWLNYMIIDNVYELSAKMRFAFWPPV